MSDREALKYLKESWESYRYHHPYGVDADSLFALDMLMEAVIKYLLRNDL